MAKTMKKKVITKGFQYDELMICGETVSNLVCDSKCYGYKFHVRYPSYRGTFLSCIEELKATVDGKEIKETDLRFELNGKEFLISELQELHREYWYIMDIATLKVLNNKGLSAGLHNIGLTLRHRIPYTGYFGKCLVLDSAFEKTLRLRERS